MGEDVEERHGGGAFDGLRVDEIEARAKPVVFRKAIVKSWPAFRKWDQMHGKANRLKELAGQARVDVMYSKDGDFNGDIRKHEKCGSNLSDVIDLMADAWDGRTPRASVYLAQNPIAKLGEESCPLSPLMADISMPQCLLRSKTPIEEVNFWLATQASCSSLHYDPYHNFLSVVRGTKQVTLMKPGSVQPNPVFSEASNHTAQDIDSRAGEASVTVDLKAGDVLFLPEGWWHRVKSSPATIAVSIWFRSSISTKHFGNHMDAYFFRMLGSNLVELKKKELISRIEKLDWKKHTKECNGCRVLSAGRLLRSEHGRWTSKKRKRGRRECDAFDGLFVRVLASLSPVEAFELLSDMREQNPELLRSIVLDHLTGESAELLTSIFEECEVAYKSAGRAKEYDEFFKVFYEAFPHEGKVLMEILRLKEAFAKRALKMVIEECLM